jgi:hypothetical protein
MEAVLEALYAALQVIVNLVQFGQLVSSGTPSSNPATQQQLAAVESTLETLGQEIQQYSTQILAALSTLDQQVFGNQMADMLSYADQAGIALAEWEQSQNSAAQAQALNTSEAGLAGIIEEYNGQVYPDTSMMIVLGRVALQRAAVLSIFPTMRATADNQQIQAAVQYLTASVNPVAAYVNAMNQVQVSSQYVVITGPTDKPVDHYYIVLVYYTNLEGNETYSKSTMGPTLQAAMQAAQPYITQAEQVQTQGLADDLAYYQVTGIEKIIQDLNQFLSN